MTKQEFDILYKEKVCEALNGPLLFSGDYSLFRESTQNPSSSNFLGNLFSHILAFENSSNGGELISIDNANISGLTNGNREIQVTITIHANPPF